MEKSARYLAAFAFIGSLFILKYAPRLHLNPILSLLGYLGFFIVQLWSVGLLARQMRKTVHPKRLLFLGLAIYLIAALTIYLRVDPMALQVDRWSALDHFLGAMTHGHYPYQVTTHLNHPISGFPGLFLLALPFYGLGDVGYLQFAALIGFAALVVLKFQETGKSLFLLGLLIGLPVFEYEIFVRSDLFSNMVAVAWLIHLGLRAKPAQSWMLLFWGVAWGLMLSTRGVVLIPLILSACYLLHGQGWKGYLIFGAALSTVFFATFLPFYCWDPRLFMEHNPFDVQSGYIPGWGLALVVLVACFLGHRHRENPRLFLHSGTLLYVTVLGCWVLKSMKIGWGQALWNNGFDISYFSLALPFLIIGYGESLSFSKAGIKDE